jgi:hypothetical protein
MHEKGNGLGEGVRTGESHFVNKSDNLDAITLKTIIVL